MVVISQLQPISVIFTTSEDNLGAILKLLHAGTKMSVMALRPRQHHGAGSRLPRNGRQLDRHHRHCQAAWHLQQQGPRALSESVRQYQAARRCHQIGRHRAGARCAQRLAGRVRVRHEAGRHSHRALFKSGPVDGKRTSIKSGLQVGERVVIDGSDRLKDGAKITIPADKAKAASEASGASGASAASATAPASAASGGRAAPQANRSQ
ncbi:putative Co/Zn/Cd efflux system membrane fusion protein [Candidatus Paraburkholderia calva]|nr:putative Co/Zn/Cd efflux system membrane fusion protein [Candidatus Paraburkholderia calva]